MSRASKPILIVLGIVTAAAVALHLFAGPLMSSLRLAIHGR